MNYYVYSANDGDKMPIIIHIHGAGSRGSDMQLAIDSNPILKYAKGLNGNFPFKVYAPHCCEKTWFEIYEQLLEFIEFVKSQESNSDIYLTGISMGGYCSWQLLQSKPNFFKKAIICCGGGMYWNAAQIKTPVKSFHGKLDKVVFFEESVKMCRVINENGGSADLILFDDLEHNCWDKTFSNQENYEWLLK